MPEAGLDAARAELKTRQGLGARYDAPDAPALALDWARRGTAYFARKLNELSNADLEGPSLIPGWSRRHVIAATAYQARMLARAVEAARTGTEIALYETEAQHEVEIEDGATLPSEALRHLVQHAAIHLNVEWRDLADGQWSAPLPYPAFPTATQTVFARAETVWRAAINLNNGGAMRDLPADLRAHLEAPAPLTPKT